MPVIQSEAGKMSLEQKEKLIAGFTATASTTLGIDAAHFYVLIKENDPENWGVGGQILTKFLQKSAKA